MKRLFNVIKNVLPKNLGNSGEKRSFFQDPLNVTDVNKEGEGVDYSGTRIEDNLKELDMVLLTGMNRKKVFLKIEEIVFQSNFSPIPNRIQDACEIVHFALKYNEPVRLSHVKQIIPDIDIDQNDVIKENAYQDWLKSKAKIEPDLEYSIKVEDTYKMRNTSWGENTKSFNEMPQQTYEEEWKKNK